MKTAADLNRRLTKLIKVKVDASKNYDIIIGRGLLANSGEYIKAFAKNNVAVIISDDKVFALFGKTVKQSLEKAGIRCFSFVFENGEKSKNAETYIKILNFLAENKICRKDLLVALGGGVVGDMAGFVAATYLRGIPFIQLPTTLLAAVDSSVGGKTAIDLSCGKNLVGAFYQPELVLCDCDTLETLDDENFKSGMAEVIKYAVIKDKKLYDYLLSDSPDIEEIISTCVKIKSEIVNRDEFDTGVRQILNFGHTFGHAIEADSDFEVIHGFAVAIGMCAAAKVAYKNGICSEETKEKILGIIKEYNLPDTYDITPEKMAELMLSDKKVMGSSINMIMPKEIGECEILPVSTENILNFIKAVK